MRQSKEKIANAKYQRKFKEKMYNAGFRQAQVWVMRAPKRRDSALDQKTFVQKLKKLAAGMGEESQSLLYSLLIKIAEAKKEALRIKRGAKKAGGE